MKVLVTGANGFLGRHVVSELLRRRHDVRAMVRPGSDTRKLQWSRAVDVFEADLRSHDLAPAFDGVDVLIHLAATVVGDEDTQLQQTIVGTTRLLQAMAGSKTRRIVLASSFSVYDFAGSIANLDESSSLERDLYRRDGYAVAKTWQERIVRRECESHNWDLTVLRPGFIWGAGNEYLSGIGQQLGRFHLIFGPLRRLPLTHAINCAHCFVDSIENPEAINQTFNVIDDESISAWKYLGRYLRGNGEAGVRIPLPYFLCAATIGFAKWTSDRLFDGKGKLPSILVPCRFRARFRPLRYSNRKLHDKLNWRQPLTFEQAVAQTWPAKPVLAAENSDDLETVPTLSNS